MVLLAVLAVRVSANVGLPSLLIYLGMGIVLGESVLGVRFDDARTAHALGFAALVVILTEGGLTTRWSDIRPSIGLGLALALAVAVCAAIDVAPSGTPDGGSRALNLLQSMRRGLGHTECGVYARVVTGGRVAVGDAVELE